MAVDANVIIFARIREEIAKGKTVKSAIDIGYKKATSAIVDGNVTTLIAAESTGAICGLGMRIKALANSYETAPMLLYIIIVGIIGMLAEKILKYFERKLTSWQEKREI